VAGWGYDVVGALEATPGTEELLAIARRVDRVDAAAASGLGRRLATLADGMDDAMRAVGGGGDDVGRAWQGPGADAFTRYTADFAHAGAATGDAARAAQRELTGLGHTLAALRDEVAGHVSDALDAAYSRTDPTGTTPSADEVRAAVAGPTARARAALDRAEDEVASCARRLRALTEGMTGWSRLRSPDAGVSGTSGASSRWADRRPAPAEQPVRAARITGGDDGSGDDGGSGADGGSGQTAGAHHGHVSSTDDGSPHGDGGSTADAGQDPGDDGGSGEAASSGPGGGPPGRVGDWIRQATAILAQHGVPADEMDPDDIATIIDHESGGDPDATNGWDSNAAHGTPSIGLMQTIRPTFAAHELPGHGDIHDPVDNIIAGVRYAIARYGSVSQVPGVRALAHGHGYVGY
jgi:hypothetical protein